MTKSSKHLFLRKVAAVALSISVITACAACAKSGHVEVTILNSSTTLVTGAQLMFGNQQVPVGSLKHAESKTVTIHPREDSDLTLEYTDGLGQVHIQRAQVYLEASTVGWVKLNILSNGQIQRTDHFVIR